MRSGQAEKCSNFQKPRVMCRQTIFFMDNRALTLIHIFIWNFREEFTRGVDKLIYYCNTKTIRVKYLYNYKLNIKIIHTVTFTLKKVH